MDGYAIRLEDFSKTDSNFNVEFEIQAGDTSRYQLSKGGAARIFTGAPLPENGNAVVMQEHTTQTGNQVTIHESALNPEQNIRQVAEQVKEGDVALKKGTVIQAATIGYLSSLGITQVEVFKKPSVAVLNTGNELIEPGSELKFGQIYESNSPAILSALHQSGLWETTQIQIPDSFEDTKSTIKKALETFDTLILTGGISVGDYDFVGKALRELGVKEVFYKVKQKPGKPLFFGKFKEKSVFALPGNPAAALSCYFVYVRTALRLQIGMKPMPMCSLQKKALNSFTKNGDRGQFLKAIYTGDQVKILEGQSSNMMHTFALANCLVYLDEKEGDIKTGDLLNVVII